MELHRDDVREIGLGLEGHLDLERLGALVAKRDPLLHPGADEALARDRDRVARQAVRGAVPEVERRPEVLDAARGEQERSRAADSEDESREEAGVVREEPARLGGDVPAVVADAEGRSFEDREHYEALRTIRPPLDWARALITISSMFTCSGRVMREEDAVRDVVRGQRLDSLVRRLRRRLVTLEADERELGLREPGIDGRDPDRAAEEILPQAVDEASNRELRGDVDGGVRVRLPARDRAGEQDVPAVAHVRQREARDADRAVDVRVQDGRLVLGIRLGEGVAPEREPGVVVEDVDPAELGRGARDERSAALLVGDVERKRDVGLDSLDPPRTADDPHAGLAQLPHGGGSEAARRTGDDGSLPLELHGRRLVARRSLSTR